MTIEWNKVTWYSKLIAVILFLATFAIAFRLGVLYKEVQILNTQVEEENASVENISRDFSLKVGSERVIGKLKIKLLDITSDSRCPSDVQCIWEGTLNSVLEITSEGVTVEKEVALGKETRFLDYTISIKDVFPVKNSTTSISKADYLINYHIQK